MAGKEAPFRMEPYSVTNDLPYLSKKGEIVHESDADGTGFDPAALEETKKFSRSGNKVESPEAPSSLLQYRLNRYSGKRHPC
jgi:hypothetical protein